MLHLSVLDCSCDYLSYYKSKTATSRFFLIMKEDFLEILLTLIAVGCEKGDSYVGCEKGETQT
jgi:hypothetical protein